MNGKNTSRTVHINRDTRHRLPCAKKFYERCVHCALDRGEVERAEVSVTFVDDGVMRSLNRRYRKLDRTTDVMAFQLSEPQQETLLGDVYVSMDRVIAQAREHGVARREESARLLIHGVLHLCGFRDGSVHSRSRMFSAQEDLVTSILEDDC